MDRPAGQPELKSWIGTKSVFALVVFDNTEHFCLWDLFWSDPSEPGQWIIIVFRFSSPVAGERNCGDYR